MTEIRKDMLKVKKMISEVEMIIGKREGETELVNKLIDAENLLTFCMSRLENAIVPPCKVGDTVYIKNRPMLISFLQIENEVTYVVQFDCDDCGDCPFYVDDVSFEGEHDCRTMGYIEFTEKDIGKTVFRTKEEAEQALKERVNSDRLWDD